MGDQILNESMQNDLFVFIVGSPRSGTTILGELLDKHPYVGQWYEPYFVWDRFFRETPHDERTAADATSRVKEQICRDYTNYKQKKKCLVLVDKSPRNSLKIPFILEIFPGAKFLHLLRDGRDVTLSIHKEWIRRRHIVENPAEKGKFNYLEAIRVIRKFLTRQPFIRDKIKALWFETHGHFFDKTKHLNRLRWKGEIGWGPRFNSWESIYYQSALLQFNAYQWLNCIMCIKQNWHLIPKHHRLTIRYEDLIRDQDKKISEILSFIGIEGNNEFMTSLPKLKANNYNKWKKEFTMEELRQIHPILSNPLIELDYAESEIWINEN
jgi:hypothetical protein